MIYHTSIPTNEPARVATVIAELWGGKAFPFPPCEGGWIAMAGDERNSAVECYPQQTVMEPGRGEDMVQFVPGQPVLPLSAFHMAVATSLTVGEVHRIAQREGWRSVVCARGGGMFHVIEFWLENSLMIEVLTAEMQAEYLGAVTIPNWEAMLASGAYGPPPALAA